MLTSLSEPSSIYIPEYPFIRWIVISASDGLKFDDTFWLVLLKLVMLPSFEYEELLLEPDEFEPEFELEFELLSELELFSPHEEFESPPFWLSPLLWLSPLVSLFVPSTAEFPLPLELPLVPSPESALSPTLCDGFIILATFTFPDLTDIITINRIINPIIIPFIFLLLLNLIAPKINFYCLISYRIN